MAGANQAIQLLHGIGVEIEQVNDDTGEVMVAQSILVDLMALAGPLVAPFEHIRLLWAEAWDQRHDPEKLGAFVGLMVFVAEHILQHRHHRPQQNPDQQILRRMENYMIAGGVVYGLAFLVLHAVSIWFFSFRLDRSSELFLLGDFESAVADFEYCQVLRKILTTLQVLLYAFGIIPVAYFCESLWSRCLGLLGVFLAICIQSNALIF